MQVFEYDDRTCAGFIVEVKSKALFTGVWGKLIY
jgi:hypothetical protein